MKFVKVRLSYIVNRFWLIVLIYISSIVLASTLFSCFENKSFLDGLWWACVSALTIGYGDIFPVTTAGRITGILFGHFWIFGVIPMIIANIINNLLEDRDLFSHVEQEELKLKLNEILKKLD